MLYSYLHSSHHKRLCICVFDFSIEYNNIFCDEDVSIFMENFLLRPLAHGSESLCRLHSTFHLEDLLQKKKYEKSNSNCSPLCSMKKKQPETVFCAVFFKVKEDRNSSVFLLLYHILLKHSTRDTPSGMDRLTRASHFIFPDRV